MAVSVQRREQAIELRNGIVRIGVHLPTLRMQVSREDGTVALRGARPRLIAHDRPVLAVETVADGVEDADTPLGRATRLTLISRTPARIDLTWHLDLGEGWSGFVLELVAENRGEASVRINALDPVYWSRDDEGEVTLGDPEELHFYQMGYQSWSPAGFQRLRDRAARPLLPVVRRLHASPFAPGQNRHLHVSECATSLRAPGQPGMTLGFLTHRRFLNHIEMRHHGAELRELVARVPTEGVRLQPQETLAAERLWFGLDSVSSDGIAEWATRTGIEMDAPVPAAVGSGWCSWYQYFTEVGAHDIRTNLDELARLEMPLETVQIDDGYQAAVGDWLEWADEFPDGIAPLARAIGERGFRAGLWLAPFLAARGSRTAEDHPEWLLRDGGGRPVVANFNPAWKGRVCYALDPTHPGVQDWLGEVIGKIRGFGFDYLKLDFLYAGALAGRRHDEFAPTGEAYRRGIATIRQAAGPDAFLLGCGAPLGPSIGLFDAMRIGPDTAPRWRSRALDLLLGVRAAPSAENSVRNILARAPLHQRLWVNDPDCVLLRDSDTRLGKREVETLAGAVLTSGGLVVVSDDLAKLGAERRTLLRRLLPTLGRPPEQGAPLADPNQLLVRLADQSALLFWVNLGRRARASEIDLTALGFDEPVHVYDVWADRPLGVRASTFSLPPVSPRGSLLLRLTPANGPRLVGSTLHLGAGALEGAALATSDQGGIRLSLRLPGTHQGRVWVAQAAEDAVPVHVGFSDQLDLEVAGSSEDLEESEEIPDR